MTIPIKNKEGITKMRESCAIAATVLDYLKPLVRPGVTTQDLEEAGRDLIIRLGARSACYGYQHGSRRYPAHTCISVNDEVVHGLAKDRHAGFGDIISLDVGVVYNGFIGDNARTVAVGGCSVEAQQLMDVTEQALYLGIAQAVPGKRVVDISRAIQQYVEGNGYSVVREFVGHGVGRSMHEEPQVPNFDEGKKSPKLEPGMTLAIEPMVNAGTREVKLLDDGWTVVTKDGQLSAHFEHTVLVTAAGPEILTCRVKTPSELKAT